MHYADPNSAPACAVDEHWDCGAVNTSRYAEFPARSFDDDPNSKTPHIPVAAIGIGGYALMLALAAAGRWKLLLPVALIGCAVAGYLTYLEAYVIRKWCIYCLWSQGIIATIVLATLVAMALRNRSGTERRLSATAAV